MSEMIERVARAIQDTPSNKSLDQARAAIEAMREPTQAMIECWEFSDQEAAGTAWRGMIDAALKSS